MDGKQPLYAYFTVCERPVSYIDTGISYRYIGKNRA